MEELKRLRRDMDEDEDLMQIEQSKRGFLGKTARLFGFAGPSQAEQRLRLNRAVAEEYEDLYNTVERDRRLVAAFEAAQKKKAAPPAQERPMAEAA